MGEKKGRERVTGTGREMGEGGAYLSERGFLKKEFREARLGGILESGLFFFFSSEVEDVNRLFYEGVLMEVKGWGMPWSMTTRNWK